jgi:integrase
MRWAELDIDNAMWSLPPGRTKNGLPHLVPMSQPVIEIVEARDHIGEYVFTTTGVTPFSGFSRCKARVDRRMGDRDWVLHDLRRTFVTRLNELGVQPHIVEAAVNHITGVAKAGVAGIYNHAQYLDERAMALTRWADTLLGIVGEGSGGIVLELRQRGQGDV